MQKHINSYKPLKPISQRLLTGLLLLCLLLLLTGCAPLTPKTITITRLKMINPPPLPLDAIRPIQLPQLTSKAVTHEDLLQLIADYHLKLTQANSDRQQIHDLWPD